MTTVVKTPRRENNRKAAETVNINQQPNLAKRKKLPLKKNNLVYIPKINTNLLDLEKAE